MSFSINTDITSLRALNTLNTSTCFQAKTINDLTSGLRIVNSGVDVTGLAIANGLGSSRAVLTQRRQNANKGLPALQTIDGRANNTSTLLDRASATVVSITRTQADISTVAGALAAVGTLRTALTVLGTAQAPVGKGENNLDYSVAPVNSEHAKPATEAAILSKAQILAQAGTAARARANPAP